MDLVQNDGNFFSFSSVSLSICVRLTPKYRRIINEKFLSLHFINWTFRAFSNIVFNLDRIFFISCGSILCIQNCYLIGWKRKEKKRRKKRTDFREKLKWQCTLRRVSGKNPGNAMWILVAMKNQFNLIKLISHFRRLDRVSLLVKLNRFDQINLKNAFKLTQRKHSRNERIHQFWGWLKVWQPLCFSKTSPLNRYIRMCLS